MGTPIIDVYRKFLGMIEDEEWLLVEDEVIEDLMLNYLENATVDSVATVKFSAAWAGDKLDTRDFSGVKLDSNTLTISGNTKVAKDVYAATSTT